MESLAVKTSPDGAFVGRARRRTDGCVEFGADASFFLRFDRGWVKYVGSGAGEVVAVPSKDAVMTEATFLASHRVLAPDQARRCIREYMQKDADLAAKRRYHTASGVPP